jgi:hypothetical protein
MLRSIYTLLLWLYPREYRALFGAEMSAAFDEAVRDQRRGCIGAAGLFLNEMSGLVLAAVHEWIAKLVYSLSHSVSYINGRCLADPLLMRAPGVAWLEHYGPQHYRQQHYRWELGAPAAQTDYGRPTDGWYGDSGAGCPNAYQVFALASPFRRLVILIVGFGRCRHCS